MSCHNLNITLPEFPDPGPCRGDYGSITPRYLYPPTGEHGYPVLSARHLNEAELASAATGKTHELTMVLTEDTDPGDLLKLRAGLPGGVHVDRVAGWLQLKRTLCYDPRNTK